MKHVEDSDPSRGDHEKPPELDRQYGKIGISAVAAAVRYQSDPKNLAYAPVTMQTDDRFEEIAA